MIALLARSNLALPVTDNDPTTLVPPVAVLIVALPAVAVKDACLIESAFSPPPDMLIAPFPLTTPNDAVPRVSMKFPLLMNDAVVIAPVPLVIVMPLARVIDAELNTPPLSVAALLKVAYC